jgi:hypothetical protein
MNHVVRRVALAVLSSLLASAAIAQEASPEEVVAYHTWYTASQSGEIAAATEAAKAFLAKFPKGENAGYVQKWLGQLRGGQFNQAIKDGNTAELVRIGREQLAENPDDLSYLISLSVNLRKNVLLGSQRNPEWEAAAGQFAAKAIALIEGGATPPGTDPATWSKDAALALLHQTVALSAQKADQDGPALAHFEASLKLAPGQAGLAGYNGFYCGKLRNDKYSAALAAYQALPEEERAAAEPGEQVKAARAEVEAQADATIACWAAFLGATSKSNPFGEVRSTIQEGLKAMWATRHPDAPDGWQELVAKSAE